ncbi:MAG TPA: VWA domain-containing protein, partial [Chloroflexota bacterium]|nr:VWA domain-containing protein [Chloroflexota bacterium]
PDWSGGTRIGQSLRAFNRDFRSAVNGRTTLLLLSDGLDTGDLELLADEMAVLRRRAGRLIWLNPLAGGQSRPLARGLHAALPHVDVLAPANNLRSLEALATELILR